MIFVLVVNLFTTRVLLHTLGVTDYGIYNVVGGVVSFMAFLQSAMANGFQRYFNIALGKNDDDKFLKFFSVSIGVQIIISSVFLLLAETIGLWFVNTQMTIPADRMLAANIVYQSAILVFLLTMITSPYNAVIIAYEKMHIFAVVSIVNVFLKLGIAYLAIIGSDRLILYAALTVLVQLILTLSYSHYSLQQNDKISIKPCFDKAMIMDMMGFSGWNLFGSLAHTAKGHGLNIVLNMFFDPAVNAARGVAYQVMTGVTSFFHNFQTAARPQVIKYYAQDNIPEMLKLSNRISKFSFMLLWIFDLPLLFTADYFIALWLGEKMPPLAPVFTNIILITTSLECFSNPISNLVHATGKMRNFQVGTSVVLLLIVPMAYLVLKMGGSPESALYCSLFMAPVVQATRLILVKKLLPFSIRRYLIDVILPCMVVAVASLIPAYILCKYFTLHPIVEAFILLLISVLAIVFFGCTRSERLAVFSKIKNRRK